MARKLTRRSSDARRGNEMCGATGRMDSTRPSHGDGGCDFFHADFSSLMTVFQHFQFGI